MLADRLPAARVVAVDLSAALISSSPTPGSTLQRPAAGDQHEVADSIRRNHFEFAAEGHLLTAEEAWSLFVASFLRHAPMDRTTTIRHKQLMNNPAQAVELIMNAIIVSGPGA